MLPVLGGGGGGGGCNNSPPRIFGVACTSWRFLGKNYEFDEIRQYTTIHKEKIFTDFPYMNFTCGDQCGCSHLSIQQITLSPS
jgi:hypothetical protein